MKLTLFICENLNKVYPMFMYKLLLLNDIIGIINFMQFYECVEYLYKSKVWIQIKSFDFRNDASYLGNVSIKLMM